MPEVDPERLGLWGISYSDGHVLTASALDKRIKRAVAQVPLVSGQRTLELCLPPNRRVNFLSRLMDDYAARATGLVPGKTIAAIPGSETEE